MPPLNPIKILADLIFFSKGLKMPTDWEQPSGDPAEDQYGKALKLQDKIAIPNLIPPWYMPENFNKYHQETCDKKGKWFKDFAYDMLDAIVFAHNMWKLQAKFKDLKVMAVCAIGAPGCLDGPELKGLIQSAPTAAKHMATQNGPKWVKAVAEGVSKNFKEWQDKVMVPGLPWYPAFAAWPGPMAPPMPNIPMPLIACPSAMMSKIIVPSELASAMDDALDGGMKDKERDHKELFEAIATPLALAFLLWLPQQMVMLVMGKGPVPVFAPPYVPVGPVVGGDNIPTPGHLMA